VKARKLDGDWYSPVAYKRVHEEQEARGQAEYLRVLYVAATRARERLIFSGELPLRNDSRCWRKLLDEEPSLIRIDATAPVDPLGATTVPGARFEDEAIAALAATEPLNAALPTRLEVTTTGAADLVLCPRRYQLRQLWRWPDRPDRMLQRELPEDLPVEEGPRQLGSYAHRLLEVVDLARAATDPAGAVEQAARSVWGPPEERRQISGEVQALLASPFGRRICALPPDRIWRERDFALRIGPAPDLILRGSIDLLCILDGKALVIDYKRGPPRLEPSYRAQVDLYALAASRLLGGHLPVEGGLWFLKEAAQGPGLWAIGAERLREIETSLRPVATELLSMPDARIPWPGIEAPRCRRMGCGYVDTCHPGAPTPL
jgi:ATP-dependent exoDNAse (exonuclease V) beta subunit